MIQKGFRSRKRGRSEERDDGKPTLVQRNAEEMAEKKIGRNHERNGGKKSERIAVEMAEEIGRNGGNAETREPKRKVSAEARLGVSGVNHPGEGIFYS